MRKLIAIFVALGLAFPAMAATNITAKPGEKLVIHVPTTSYSVVYKTVYKPVAVPVYHTVYKASPPHVVYRNVYRATPPGYYVQRGGILTEAGRGIVTGGEEVGSGIYHGAVGVATGVGDVLGGLFGGLFAPRVCWNGYTQYYC